jgi:hypothetical protein
VTTYCGIVKDLNKASLLSLFFHQGWPACCPRRSLKLDDAVAKAVRSEGQRLAAPNFACGDPDQHDEGVVPGA